jgi:hypothetical protein
LPPVRVSPKIMPTTTTPLTGYTIHAQARREREERPDTASPQTAVGTRRKDMNRRHRCREGSDQVVAVGGQRLEAPLKQRPAGPVRITATKRVITGSASQAGAPDTFIAVEEMTSFHSHAAGW